MKLCRQSTIFTLLDNRTQGKVDGFANKSKKLLWWCLILIVILIVICVLSYLIYRKITLPVASLVHEVEAIADGDLTRKFESRSQDEIGQLSAAMKKMIDNLREMFLGVTKGIDTLAKASEELSGIAANMASISTVDEINKVNEVIKGVDGMAVVVASAIEEQSATTREIAANVNQASTGIQEVTENVSQSSTTLSNIASDINSMLERFKV